MTPITNILNRLDGVRADGSGWSARCPCRNDDHNPSLHVAEGTNNQVLLTCHRGDPCTLDQICTAMGVTVNDLFVPDEPKRGPGRLTLVKTYPYTDADGTLLFEKQRFIDETGRKTFRQRRPDGTGGWTWSLGDTPKVLYRLPSVLHAVHEGRTVWVVEGEKDADSLVKAGLVATTMPGGAGKWLPIHTDALAGATVRIIADNDDPGRSHAATVRRALERAGCTVTVLAAPAPHKDVTDLLQAGGSVTDLTTVSDEPSDTVLPLDTPEPDPFTTAAAEIAALATRNLTDTQKLARARALLDRANPTVVDVGRLTTWADLVAETETDHDWVIPGLLERGERVIVVATEGVGKTMLARQMAILPAAGIHPYTKQPIPKIKTLMVDLENPERIIRRKSAAMYRTVANFTTTINAHLLIKPSGLNLLRPDERAALETVIDDLRPDLLFIGPIYKSFIDPGGRNSEAVTTELIMYFDHLRDTYNCALWFEAHAPLGTTMTTRDLRPFGSAVWSRWPEFGLSLSIDPTATQPTYEINFFRGQRDERPWPKRLERGKTFPFDVIEYHTTNQ